MRRFASVAVILLFAAVPLVLAEEAKGEAKSHDVTMTLVSMDLEQSTVTLKGADGKDVTVPVKGEALASLKSKKVKAGDSVIATCQDDAEGNHEAVTDLKPAKT